MADLWGTDPKGQGRYYAINQPRTDKSWCAELEANATSEGWTNLTWTEPEKDPPMSTNTDRHANARDRKAARAKTNKLMRGNRSVFEIQKSVAKRGRKAKGLTK